MDKVLTALVKGAQSQAKARALAGDFLLNGDFWPSLSTRLGGLRRAAVALILFYDTDGELSLLLNQRAQGLKHHSAQVGFPGGKRDPDDQSFLATALREVREEIGLTLLPEHLQSPLAPYASGSGFLVQPFVFLVPDLDPAQLTLEAAEVEAVFAVKIGSLTAPQNSIVGLWGNEDPKRYWPQFATDPAPLWGLSAGIVVHWLSSAGFALSLPVPHPCQPKPLDALVGVDDMLDVS